MTVDPFAHRVPSTEQIARIEPLREAYRTLLQALEAARLNRWSPTSHNCYTQAVRRLEESAMWAIKSIVLEEEA